ncbi:MAG: 1-acyl-sn-glycerol-3-phosphate acyltransferase [Spirochaetes bacterium]|nr:1-acyl-sn-glycerol-3-phosphate acyltransferase [Spirochaetota bacterium]
MQNNEENSKNGIKYKSSTAFDGVIDGFINSLLENFAGFLFGKIDFDAESLQTIKEYSNKNNIVYVSFHSSNISLLIFCHLLKKHNIDLPIVALDENPYMMQTIKHLSKRVIKSIKKRLFGKKYEDIFETDYIEKQLWDKKSILVSLFSRKFFLRRYMEIKYDSLTYLVKLQKTFNNPIYLLPQMIFWNLNPERTNISVASQATGDRGLISGLITTLKSATPAFVRILSPINVAEEIENAGTNDPEQIAIALRNKLLEKYYHEKRAATGPVIRSNQEMMEKVLYHKDVLEMIEKQAKREKVSERHLRKNAYEYYRELAANYSVLVLSLCKRVVEFILNKIYDGIQYDPESIRKIREASKKGPLILLPTHKSYLDFIIVPYLFFINKLSSPHIVAGKNMAFFPLGTLFRRSGAFFIRRTFRGLKLYSAIVKQYVRTLLLDGYSILVFMEGTRSRTGKLLLPKLGILYYIIDAIYAGYNEDLVFVPIAIDYDRILEEKAHLKQLKGGKKTDESMSDMIKSRKVLKKKYGKVYVSFSDPFTLKEISAGITDIKAIPDLVANTVINKISGVTVVTPFALTTTAMLILSTKGFSKLVLIENSKALFLYLQQTNSRFSDTLHKDADIDEIIEHVLESYLEDNIIQQIKIESGTKEEIIQDLYVLKDDNRIRINYYKNCIIHYFIPISLTSMAILYINKITGGKAVKEADVKKEYEFIKDLFRREFIYKDDDNLSDIIHDEVYKYFKQKSVLSREKDGMLILNNNINNLKIFASIMKDHFESYYAALKTIVNLKAGQVKKEKLVMDIRKNALKMFHMGEIYLWESLSLPFYVNAISRFSDEKILKGGARDVKNAEIKLEDTEKAGIFLQKIEDYLNIIR